MTALTQSLRIAPRENHHHQSCQPRPVPATEIVNGIVKYQHFIEPVATSGILRCATFMAQLAHESAGFQTTREFASGKVLRRQEGPGMQPGDGTAVSGRGLIQTTGRANYRKPGDDIRRRSSQTRRISSKPQDPEKFLWALLSAVCTDAQGRSRTCRSGRHSRLSRAQGERRDQRLDDRKRHLKRAKGIWGHLNGWINRVILRVDCAGDWVSSSRPHCWSSGRVAVDGCLANTPSLVVVHFPERSPPIADGNGN